MTNTAAAHAVSLTTNLDHQLEQARELRNLAYAVIIVEGVRDLTMAQRIALAMFYRSLQTHEAIEILVRQQLVEDAQVLSRVVVEHVVNCAYMLVVADEQTAGDFVKFPRYWNYFLMRDLKAVDETRFRKQVTVELEDEIRKEYEDLLPRFENRRNGEWCVDAKLHQRAARVDDGFAEYFKKPFNEFRWLVNSQWRFAGSHVHGNADSLLEQVSRSENVMTIEQKFDAEDAAEALYTANFALTLVLYSIDGLLGAKNIPAISAQLSKFNGYATAPAFPQELPIPPTQTTS
jgi:Family of unknown function (DUF5677)